MGLLRRAPRADLRLEPPGPYRATDMVSVAVTLPEALDAVVSARVELGYVNEFRYVWTGAAGGSNPGTAKDGEAWVQVLEEPLPVTAGVLAAETRLVTFRLPSWSPGSSERAVRWQVRLRVDRRGRDVAVDVPLEVLVAAPEPTPDRHDLPLVQGERASANSIAFDVTTERTCYRPGDQVRGVLGLTAREPVTRTALVAAWFQKLHLSHPLDKQPPAQPSESFTPRPMIDIAKDVQLVAEQRVELPFVLPLPAGIDPTTEAVHSSLTWNIEFKVEFSGLTGAIERAQLPIVVHTD